MATHVHSKYLEALCGDELGSDGHLTSMGSVPVNQEHDTLSLLSTGHGPPESVKLDLLIALHNSEVQFTDLRPQQVLPSKSF